MPLFDSTDIKSKEISSLHSLADVISRCTEFIELSGTANAPEAYEKIFIGEIEDPFDSEEYTIDQLSEMFFVCQIASANEEGMEAVRPVTETECPAVGGSAEIYLRRCVRESEIGDSGRRNAFLFFNDRVSAIQVELISLTMAENCVRVARVPRMIGPHWATTPEAAGQGEYLWAELRVEWGELDLLASRN